MWEVSRWRVSGSFAVARLGPVSDLEERKRGGERVRVHERSGW